jgi:S1-C subfamily serine protease
MKKLAHVFLALVFLLTSCFPVNAPGVTSEYTIRHVIDSSVAIEMVSPSTGEWRTIGSGTVVRRYNDLYMGREAKYAILTAEHVVDGMDVYQMRACSDVNRSKCVPLGDTYFGGGTTPGTFDGDWAWVPVYSLPDPMSPIRIRGDGAHLGEKLYFIGHPWGDFFLSNGMASGYRTEGDTRIDKMYGYVAPGSSGGAILDGRGRLVGIIVGVPIRPDPMDFPQYQHDIVLGVSIESVVW